MWISMTFLRSSPMHYQVHHLILYLIHLIIRNNRRKILMILAVHLCHQSNRRNCRRKTLMKKYQKSVMRLTPPNRFRWTILM